MDFTSKSKKLSQKRVNVLESLKELGDSTSKSFKNDLLREGSKDVLEQLFGRPFIPSRSFSGELMPGSDVSIDQILSGRQEKEEKLQKQLNFERRLRAEEQSLLEKKSNELKLTLHALTEELKDLASNTPNLAEEIEIAVMQAPVNPGIYHVFFFEKLLSFLKGFNEDIKRANTWLNTLNKRAAKKGFWSQYKKHGGRRLLSAEDYSQRAAG